MKSANFRFYETLNDFLSRRQKSVEIRYEFYIAPTVKDAIESIGVPHPEVDLVLVNGSSVNFEYHLENDDVIEVYPVRSRDDLPSHIPLSGNRLAERRFVLDVHLGSLAKILRLLGFDTSYNNHFDDKEIVRIAVTENRIVLTRDILLLKHKAISSGYWLRSQQTLEQAEEVIKYFRLDHFYPFSRCLECNGLIVTTSLDAVKGKVPLQVAQELDEFFTCTNCKRVYWKGSHYDKMKLLVDRLRKV